jgi:hypothetical protein
MEAIRWRKLGLFGGGLVITLKGKKHDYGKDEQV